MTDIIPLLVVLSSVYYKSSPNLKYKYYTEEDVNTYSFYNKQSSASLLYTIYIYWLWLKFHCWNDKQNYLRTAVDCMILFILNKGQANSLWPRCLQNKRLNK